MPVLLPQLKHTIYKTRHGVVQGWTTVKGQPVAIVQQRSTYDHDIDSVVGFLGFGDPNSTHDVNSWMDSASKIDFTFNWLYADDRDTGYFVSGLDPVRNPAADPTLPMWGTGRSEWNGFLGKDQHPHEVNPKQGYFISWNNKPAPGFATDGEYPYSQTYRSVLLDQQLRKQIAAHPHALERSDVVKAMETAATPGPRRRRPQRPDPRVRRHAQRARRREGDARPAEVVERHRLAPDQGQARGRPVHRPRGRRDLRRAGART